MDSQSQPPRKGKVSIALYIASAFVFTTAVTVFIAMSSVIIMWHVNRGHIVTDEDLYIALGIAALIALALSVLLGLYFAKGIGEPIARVSRAASAIREGDFSARTGMHGSDELSQLGEKFDEMADSIERDRDLERQLIGDVAHELRTPLMAVQATVEAIQDGVFPADDEHLDTISSETRRLARLVEALLHLNRLENGTIEVKDELVDLSELISGLVLAHEALVESSGLAFSSAIADRVLVHGDHDLLLQAAANLLSNAVRYTPEGGSIRMSVERAGGFARIVVADTGIGISQEDLSKVFSRFWRADAARTGSSGGLGIGLALVREVVDQHSGHVDVSSSLGEGSTFSISLPLAAEDGLDWALPSQRDARRSRKLARRQADKQRREAGKLRKIAERNARLQKRAEEKERKSNERSTSKPSGRSAARSVQQLMLFGIRMPIPSAKKTAADEADAFDPDV